MWSANPANHFLRWTKSDILLSETPVGSGESSGPAYTLPEIIDSSDLKPALWADLCQIILDKYDQYSGFVILHGTDTMAYSAAALSFMLNNLTKPVVFTGSQLPIGTIRTDGRENLIAALEIAAATIEGKAVVPEVCILFGAKLFRGNRTTLFIYPVFREIR